MSSNVTTALPKPATASDDRHRLLSFNRRLRHLQRISFRNLDFDPNAGRWKGATIDDEALPYALKSPVKLLAERERKQLVHSRSYENLKPRQEPAGEWLPAEKAGSPDDRPSTEAPLKASFKKPRRKSTLEWSSSTPAERTESLRKAVERRTADVFFTLHIAQDPEPIYVSEVVENAMNPDFCTFDLRACHASIPRCEFVTAKIWACNDFKWHLLVEEAVSLPKLDYLGRSLEHVDRELPENCLIYYLPDGVYARIADKPQQESIVPTKAPDAESLSLHVKRTSSYDSLSRLSTLDECIQEALATRAKLTADIDALIAKNKASFAGAQRAQNSRRRLDVVRRAITTERQHVLSAQTSLQKARSGLHSRRESLTGARTALNRARDGLSSDAPQLDGWREARRHMQEDLASQRRRICSDLCDIYPIAPVPKRPLAFTIRGLSLPNSDFNGAQADLTSAALGFVAHLVHVLSLYQSVPLPYPIKVSGATSTIQDRISNMNDNCTFPLYMPKAVFFRFEYGVFLLNKNIELLATRLGLRIIDIRQTLPNLKYILFVATAGKGDIPHSKASGIRTLVLKDEEKATPESSRRSSFERSDTARQAVQKHEPPKPTHQNGSAVRAKPHNQHQAS